MTSVTLLRDNPDVAPVWSPFPIDIQINYSVRTGWQTACLVRAVPYYEHKKTKEMKKILCTLIICLCCITLVCGQNFKPGQQAQGMLESKNVTVDYATGTFHYHVPVYTLKSGDYELPITLDYTARGVRVDDRPGLLGYNWTLNTGGVVTRTVRGGIADEFPSKGFIHAERAGALIDEEQFV